MIPNQKCEVGEPADARPRNSTGLLSILTRAPDTSAETRCRRRKRTWPCPRGTLRTASDNCGKRLRGLPSTAARDSRARSRAGFMRRRVRFIQTASMVQRPNADPAIDAAKMVKTVSLIPRNAPTMAISFTSPKPMPSTPRAAQVNRANAVDERSTRRPRRGAHRVAKPICPETGDPVGQIHHSGQQFGRQIIVRGRPS